MCLSRPPQKKRLWGAQVGGAVQQSGTHGVRRDAAAVKRDSGLDRQHGIGEERHAPTQAKTNARERSLGCTSVLAQPCVCSARVGLEIMTFQGAHVGHSGLEIVVCPLESRPSPVEEFGGKSMVAFTRKALRNVAEMRIHAEAS